MLAHFKWAHHHIIFVIQDMTVPYVAATARIPKAVMLAKCSCRVKLEEVLSCCITYRRVLWSKSHQNSRHSIREHFKCILPAIFIRVTRDWIAE